MPIYRLEAARLGREHLSQWRCSALRSAGWVVLTTAGCAVGLALLDSSDQPLAAKLFSGLWNAVNLVTEGTGSDLES